MTAYWLCNPVNKAVQAPGRPGPALSNPHWPVWAAREVAHNDPLSLVPEDWAWWLRNFRAHDSCIGWPPTKEQAEPASKAA